MLVVSPLGRGLPWQRTFPHILKSDLCNDLVKAAKQVSAPFYRANSGSDSFIYLPEVMQSVWG